MTESAILTMRNYLRKIYIQRVSMAPRGSLEVSPTFVRPNPYTGIIDCSDPIQKKQNYILPIL